MAPIQLLTLQDLDPYLDHLERHMAGNGRRGEIVHDPYPMDHKWDGTSRRRGLIERWNKPLSETGWERAWAIFDRDQIVGHIDLKHRGIPTNLHRACLGMGIEKDYRRKGIGRALIQEALNWAVRNTSIVWIDLGVFAHNLPAKALYDSLGFKETGRVQDAFCVDGQSIEDIQMTLRLSREP